MFSKKYFSFLLIAAFCLTAGVTAFAQVSPVRGKVLLKKADGTVVPVENATVDAYRVDIETKLAPGKTNKRGEFTFAGVQLGAQLVLVASAPNIAPQIKSNVRPGDDGVVINVVEGSGATFTEAEVRNSLKTNAAVNNDSGELTAEQKKAKEEFDLKVADAEKKNTNVKNINATVNRAVADGKKQLDAKDYDAAITSFDAGINADPDFAGTAAVLQNLKAVALIGRARDKYNVVIKGQPADKNAALPAIKKDLLDGVAAEERALTLLKDAAGDAGAQKNYAILKYNALINRKEAYRLLSRTGADQSKGKESLAAFQEYIDLTTDPKLKADAMVDLGEMLLATNEFELAITEFQKVLAQDPKDANALAIVGLSLVSVGYINNDKVKLQEGANYLQKFTDIAPDTNPLKKDAQATIESLKQSNVTPQKNSKKKP